MAIVSVAIYQIFPEEGFSETKNFPKNWTKGSDGIEITELDVPIVDFGEYYSTDVNNKERLLITPKKTRLDVLVRASDMEDAETMQKIFLSDNIIVYVIKTPIGIYYSTEKISKAKIFYYNKLDLEDDEITITYIPDIKEAIYAWLIVSVIVSGAIFLSYYENYLKRNKDGGNL